MSISAFFPTGWSGVFEAADKAATAAHSDARRLLLGMRRAWLTWTRAHLDAHLPSFQHRVFRGML